MFIISAGEAEAQVPQTSIQTSSLRYPVRQTQAPLRNSVSEEKCVYLLRKEHQLRLCARGGGKAIGRNGEGTGEKKNPLFPDSFWRILA